jgi:hypothetical protein
MNKVTAMHEISHTVGVGMTSAWLSKISNGVYTGTNATTMLRAISGNSNDVLHGDTQHFWPFGLNYVSEGSTNWDLVNHCGIVNAMKQDGI